MSRSDSAAASRSPYQDSVTAPLGREHDDDMTQQASEPLAIEDESYELSEVLTAIEKASTVLPSEPHIHTYYAYLDPAHCSCCSIKPSTSTSVV